MLVNLMLIGLITLASLSIYFGLLNRSKDNYGWQVVRVRSSDRNQRREQ